MHPGEHLGQHDLTALRRLARTLDLRPAPTRKAKLIAAIVVSIEADLGAALTKCSDTERTVLAAAAFEGPVDPVVFQARHRCAVVRPGRPPPGAWSWPRALPRGCAGSCPSRRRTP